MTNTSLVPVFTGTISNQSVQLCNARDLHCFLEVGTKFADWINGRITHYSFIQDEDYFLNFGNRSDGRAGKRRTEYHLTLDMAKELAMIENNHKGRQIRRYFISLERKAVNASNTPKALPAPEPKRYNYPRKLLEQSGFVSADGKHPAKLNISMLANTKAFISPLMHLLNEMRADGHDVSAPWDEFIAMREALIAADKALEKIYMEALQVNFRSASTAGNK
ncbi:anti-repressor protein [Nitrosomonas oligotropha]|uniref:Anti-repressor protein n=2 Tax=Nitrosomonas oligotropha TaxID=42354 RepID=A0A1H8QJE4_9PROT|nr:anti-repressor protein [Nitrosomonas oligotropha]SEO54312.1 anti-repressor protein [Nitrosomonas oligotropha]